MFVFLGCRFSTQPIADFYHVYLLCVVYLADPSPEINTKLCFRGAL